MSKVESKLSEIEYVPLIIIGGGESGIALGARLRSSLGFTSFRLFERQSQVGGTWYINRYPGVACDVPAVLYSYSFAPNPRWSSYYPPGSELLAYFQQVCRTFGVDENVQCDTEVEGARWLHQERLWEVTSRRMHPGMGDLSEKDRQQVKSEHGEDAVYVPASQSRIRTKIVCSCVGGLVQPNDWPASIPGIEKFEGDMFHSARWDNNISVQDKDVVVLGTGSSAAQFVPELLKPPLSARSVHQIMRSAPWVVPRPPPPGGDHLWNKLTPKLMSWVPGFAAAVRLYVFLLAETQWLLFGPGEESAKERSRVEGLLLAYMRHTVPSEYHGMLTPDYAIGCKRRIFDAAWLRSMRNPAFKLTNLPMTAVKARSVVLGSAPDNKEIPADVIVLANGFQATKFLHPLKVTGRDGVDLIEEMERRGGPQAYQGTALDGFPNFFLIFGPNTGTGHTSVIMATENMISYALKMIRPIIRGDVDTVEVKKSAEERYTRDIQHRLSQMVWTTGGCESWYSDNGWNSTLYPYSQYFFIWRSMFPIWRDWTVTYKDSSRPKEIETLPSPLYRSIADTDVDTRTRLSCGFGPAKSRF